MSFTSQLQCTLRKLLFLWVKVEVFPRSSPPFESNKKIQTIYILRDRGISNLLVLEQVCELQKLPNPRHHLPGPLQSHHSVYSVATRNPLIDWLQSQKKQSTMLREIVEHAQQNEHFEVQLIPVTVIWGRPLAKQKHWLKVLFADTWIVAGRVRKFFTILLHGKRCALFFAEPISLQQLSKSKNYSCESLNESLGATLERQSEIIFGPKITTRLALTNQILATESVQQQIDLKAKDKNISQRKARASAQRYCQEIISNCTQITIELMLRLLNAFWNKFYSGISVYNLDEVKKIAQTHQLVYVPCHRSHIDYLLLSYVIFTEGMAIPYIAAGDNLNLPFIGRILRGGGAFFIRRSFKDNALYGQIMREYIDLLVGMGAPLEYFIEGGRSRTGRLLKPKLGMLSMTVQAYLKTRQKPLAFIPVYIGYEKLMEGNSYLGELYGQKKQKETLLGSLRSILKLKGQFGKVTTSFGTPILLNELLDSNNSNWQKEANNDEQKPDWYLNTINQLGQEILLRINQACIINPVNMIATIVLATPRQSIDQQDLIDQGALYSRLIDALPQLKSVTVSEELAEQQIERIQDQGLINIRQHELGNIVYLNPENSVLMSYYRNNSLHTLIIPSLVACCLINARQISSKKLLSIMLYVYPFLQSELHLQWTDAELKEFILSIVDEMVTQNLLTQSEKAIRRPARSDHSFVLLMRLAQIVQPILERYYMTFVLLWEAGESPITELQLEDRCHLLAQKVSMIYGINSPDFFDRKLFTHFIEQLHQLDYVKKDEQDYLQLTDSFERVNLDIRTLLSVEVRNSLLQLLKRH